MKLIPLDKGTWKRLYLSWYEDNNLMVNRAQSALQWTLLYYHLFLSSLLNKSIAQSFFFSCVASSMWWNFTDGLSHSHFWASLEIVGLRNDIDWSWLIRNDQDRSGMIRSCLEWSGLVRNDQDWSRMIRTDQNWSGIIQTGQELSRLVRNDQDRSGLVRNDQDWSGIIRTGQE